MISKGREEKRREEKRRGENPEPTVLIHMSS
jgi:hypothetical protein